MGAFGSNKKIWFYENIKRHNSYPPPPYAPVENVLAHAFDGSERVNHLLRPDASREHEVKVLGEAPRLPQRLEERLVLAQPGGVRAGVLLEGSSCALRVYVEPFGEGGESRRRTTMSDKRGGGGHVLQRGSRVQTQGQNQDRVLKWVVAPRPARSRRPAHTEKFQKFVWRTGRFCRPRTGM